MTYPRTCVALTGIACIAVGVACKRETPSRPADRPASEASSPAGSAATVTAPERVRGPVENPTPRLVKADASVAAAGARNRHAAQLADMRESYNNLSIGEAAYFDGKFLNTDVLGEVMQSADFDSRVLDLQSGGDVNSTARQRAYTEALRRSLRPYADRARLERIGCGTVLCMGSLRTNAKDWIGPWTIELHKQSVPLPSLSIQTIRRGPEYEVRFSFTTTGPGGFSTGSL